MSQSTQQTNSQHVTHFTLPNQQPAIRFDPQVPVELFKDIEPTHTHLFSEEDERNILVMIDKLRKRANK